MIHFSGMLTEFIRKSLKVFPDLIVRTPEASLKDGTHYLIVEFDGIPHLVSVHPILSTKIVEEMEIKPQTVPRFNQG